MNTRKKGFTLVEIMVVISIIAILAAVTFPMFLRARTTSLNALAQQRLKTIATSLENYMRVNQTYAIDLSSLVNDVPPYINTNFFNGEHGGFTFSGTITINTYQVTATPVTEENGFRTYAITTGSVLTELAG